MVCGGGGAVNAAATYHRGVKNVVVPARIAAALPALALLAGACTMSPEVAPTPYVPTPFASPPAAAQVSPTASAEPVASTAAIPLERLHVAEFVRADGSGTPARLPIEVLPAGEFSVGLSGRRVLGERGMLFDYGAPGQEGAFWMKNTHIDLDIAFIDDALRIVSIRTMQAESEEHVRSAAPYQSAIEAPAGWYAAHGIREGDRVRYAPPPALPTP
jgi:uncharacterized membrane protein (UPF0127 family)